MTLLSVPILPLPAPSSSAERFSCGPESGTSFSAVQLAAGAMWRVRRAECDIGVWRSLGGADSFEEVWRQVLPDEEAARTLFKAVVEQFVAFNERCITLGLKDRLGEGASSEAAAILATPAIQRGVKLRDGSAASTLASTPVHTRLKSRLSSLVRRPKSVWSVVRALVKWFFILMGALLCFTMLMQYLYGYKGPVVRGTASTSTAGGHQVAAELRDRSLGDTLTTTEMQVVANATRELGVQMRPTGQPFVVFSDPNCPACKDLESKLSQVDPRFVPVIVPVSFKPGSDALVKRVFCAKDTVAAWSVAVGGLEATGDAASDGACSEAAQKALSANAAFTALNFSATPTLVSATGKVVAGSGSIEGINKWLDANGGLPSTSAQKP